MAARFQAAPSSAEGSQAASSSAEYEIEALYQNMAGSWDTYYRAAGAQTLSGLNTSSILQLLRQQMKINFDEDKATLTFDHCDVGTAYIKKDLFVLHCNESATVDD
ncbi:hypothetical protein FN846DRAFT_910642 [Sphaerosporella brunnea]|uniref:Uncharacterized protein n=1 Tax=Sphaerosporella brunnea TaxID=1250544 RepID=A0A5J5ELG1_9PEZI|nr:hypothetical protein FN846DRAFT_910642 [Sphaerosporella brunnea]